MSQVVTISVGRLLGRNEKLTTAKFNAVVKSIVINISGAVGTTDLSDGAVTPAKASPGAWFYAAGVLTAGVYVATYSPIAVSSYTDGLWLTFKADTICAANPSFNAGAGAKPLYRYGGQAVLNAGDIRAKGIVTVRYNTTLIAGGCWEVMSLIGPVPLTANMQGATALTNGVRGFVPSPTVGQQDYPLRGDGTFRDMTAEIDARIALNAPSANNFLLFLNSNN